MELNTAVEIKNILELDEVLSLMTLQLKLTVEWIDSRLEYVDLKSDQNLNRLTPLEMDEIWMPTLVFTNTKMRQEADFKNKSAFASIRINEGTYAQISHPVNDRLFFIIAYSFFNSLKMIFSD